MQGPVPLQLLQPEQHRQWVGLQTITGQQFSAWLYVVAVCPLCIEKTQDRRDILIVWGIPPTRFPKYR